MPCSTVPTNDQILVPETLLKKRKSQEKARAERTDAIQKRKAVRITSLMFFFWQYDAQQTYQLDFVDVVDFYTFFRV